MQNVMQALYLTRNARGLPASVRRYTYVAVNEDKIKGQRILLIDDILTTGATLREAARVLREAGAERVICATLAAADED